MWIIVTKNQETKQMMELSFIKNSSGVDQDQDSLGLFPSARILIFME